MTALLIAVTVVMLAGTAYARYRISTKAALNMSYNYSNNGVYLWASYNDNYDKTAEKEEDRAKFLPLGDWTSVSESTYTLDFLLANEGNDKGPAEFDQNVSLQIFVTEGIASASNLTVTLSTGSGEYTASASKVAAGSTVYNAYGAGWIYKFENNYAQPVNWFLKGQCASAIPMILTVTGESVEPAALSLIATGTPAD